MWRIIGIFLTGVLVSMYFFPFSLTFLPNLNSKMVSAVIGLIIVGMSVVRTRNYTVPKEYLISGFIAAIYSVFNLVAIELNDTFDYSYANYITTYFVWIFGAITPIVMIKKMHGEVTLKILTMYLAIVCAFQSVIAVVIDKNESVKAIVDSIVFQANNFFNEINRLYGIGAALDPAGTRFSVVLVMIGFVLILDDEVKKNKIQNIALLASYGIIATLGNMMSRTTTVGLALSIIPFIIHSGLHRFTIKGENLLSYRLFALAVLIGVPLMVYLYNTDPFFYEQLRYGFEGFFNWAETGEWSTASTEKLNGTMWIWPEDFRGWLIGYGIFGRFDFSTDIGYCRLILYSGVIGFSIFCSLFFYCAFFFARKYRRYKYMFIVLLGLSFIIWIKASTDLFQIYALFLAFTDEREMRLGSSREAKPELSEEEEDIEEELEAICE